MQSSVKHSYLGSQIIPCIFLLIVNILGGLHILPIFIQLLISSCSCVYLGCILAGRLSQNNDGTIHIEAQQKDTEVIGKKQALKFPVVASAFLFGFYIIYKYVNKDIVNFLITFQFCISTIVSTATIAIETIPFNKNLLRSLRQVKTHRYLKSWFDIDDFTISPASILCFIFCSIPVVAYYLTKYWALNNLYGILFSIFAIRSIKIDSFKVGFILLWLLFFYDIFWVYGTDVMVSVAKNLDIPIKLLFPYLTAQGEEKFSMLGLGDIVLPGIFVSLCLKFDIDRCLQGQNKPKKLSDFKIHYFSICMVFYFLGICATFAAMYIFNHPQPALLFLVPCCTLSVGALAMIKKQTHVFMNYEIGKKQQNEQKKQQDKKE